MEHWWLGWIYLASLAQSDASNRRLNPEDFVSPTRPPAELPSVPEPWSSHGQVSVSRGSCQGMTCSVTRNFKIQFKQEIEQKKLRNAKN
jgi:hypothetical protein